MSGFTFSMLIPDHRLPTYFATKSISMTEIVCYYDKAEQRYQGMLSEELTREAELKTTTVDQPSTCKGGAFKLAVPF